MATPAVKVKLEKFKEHNKVVRYRTEDEDAVVNSIYLSNAAYEKLGQPDQVTVIVQAS